MRTSLALTLLGALVAACLLAPPARAEEDSAFPVAAALAKAMEPMGWQDRWDAYQDVKDDLATERDSLAPARSAWRKRETEGATALSADERTLAAIWDAYIPVQEGVATALRRDQLSLGAILMGFFAASLLWGGFAVTVTIAMRSERQKKLEAAGT